MIIRKLTAFLLAICVVALIVALCLRDWECGNLFEGCTDEGAPQRDAMLSVVSMLVIGLVFVFLVFVIDVVMLCKRVVPSGLITARFVFIYLGAALVFIAVIVYTAMRTSMWGYFLSVVAATISMVIAMMAVASSRCVSKTERVVQHPN
ncbi:unnamed protein product [Mesocestoides corti]|uniref:Expressed conserved protein n=1 Tax=Mesocestoides corti TaxID=53468 RepID=A0A0R3UHP2_MESCO|nr:unnamed protein product [Mesocestoides corti]